MKVAVVFIFAIAMITINSVNAACNFNYPPNNPTPSNYPPSTYNGNDYKNCYYEDCNPSNSISACGHDMKGNCISFKCLNALYNYNCKFGTDIKNIASKYCEGLPMGGETLSRCSNLPSTYNPSNNQPSPYNGNDYKNCYYEDCNPSNSASACGHDMKGNCISFKCLNALYNYNCKFGSDIKNIASKYCEGLPMGGETFSRCSNLPSTYNPQNSPPSSNDHPSPYNDNDYKNCYYEDCNTSNSTPACGHDTKGNCISFKCLNALYNYNCKFGSDIKNIASKYCEGLPMGGETFSRCSNLPSTYNPQNSPPSSNDHPSPYNDNDYKNCYYEDCNTSNSTPACGHDTKGNCISFKCLNALYNYNCKFGSDIKNIASKYCEGLPIGGETFNRCSNLPPNYV